MKTLRRSIFFCIAIALLFVISAVVVRRLVNSEWIREKVATEFAQRFDTNLVIGDIALSWLPAPKIVLERVDLTFGANQKATIRAVEISPQFIDLLAGRFGLRRALVLDPEVKIHWNRSGKPIDLREIEEKLFAALIGFTRELHTAHLGVAGGSAEIIIDESAQVTLHDLAFAATANPGKLAVELSARSNLWQKLSVQGDVAADNSVFQFDIAIERLKINDALALAPFREIESTPEGNASFRLQISGAGLRHVEATMGGLREPLSLVRRGRRAVFEVKQFEGALTYGEGECQITVARLELASPRLEASGQVQFSAERVAAGIQAHDVDVAEVGSLIHDSMDDPRKAERFFRHLPAGTISGISLQSDARSFAELASPHNVVGRGTLRNGIIVFPDFDLELEKVNAAVRVDKGQLQADRISLQLGGMQGRSGVFRLGARETQIPFHLDVAVEADAAELLGVLRKLARDETARAELRKLRKADGKLSGRLLLERQANALIADVSIPDANVRVDYEPVPFPVAFRGGRLHFDEQLVRIENAQGSVGDSRFDAVDIRFQRDQSRGLEIASQRATIDLQQTETLLRRFESLRPQLQKLTAARGRAELADVNFAGHYDDSTTWRFGGTGRFDQVQIAHADLPGLLALTRAEFDVNRERTLFSDAAGSLVDADFLASGKIEYASEKPLRLEISGRATVGERMTGQLARSLDLPEELRLRPPLAIAAERLTWSAEGDRSFVGELGVAGGALMKMDVLKRPEELVVNNFSLEDSGRRAQIDLRLTDESLAFSFRGEVTKETLDRVFLDLPVDGGSVRGDLQVNAPRRDDPMTMSATGELSGSKLFLPIGDEKTLVEKFSLEADGRSLLVRSADLLWQDSRVSITGKVTAGKEALRIDMDASGDRLRLAELNRVFGKAKHDGGNHSRGFVLAPIEGRLGLQLDSFMTEQFTMTALQVETAIAPSSVRAEIKNGMICGIRAIGRLEAGKEEIDVDLRFSAKDADLEPTTVCLTNQRTSVKGRYSLSARLAGTGTPETLPSALKGPFQLSSRDGEFVRAAGLDATFDYLNDSGEFAVSFPDLDKKAFVYGLLSAKGNIEGRRIQSDEIFIQAAPFTVAGQGSFDLQEKKIDLKGLVSVALPARQVIKRIPVLSAALGGSLVGIPIRIQGSVDRPEVSYLSASDVGAELVNIPLRVLGMPLDAIKLFMPSETGVDP